MARKKRNTKAHKHVSLIKLPKLKPHPITLPDERPKKGKLKRGGVDAIQGIGYKKYFDFHRAGIKTLKQFVDAGIPRVSSILGYREEAGRQIYLRGLSVYQNRVIKLDEIMELTQGRVYVDIETDLTQSIVWMIGIYISQTGEFIQLVVNSPRDEKKILKECMDILSQYRNKNIITYSGTRFDERVLRNRFDRRQIPHEHIEFDDILLDIKKSLALPLKSYSLGEVASFYGYKFRHPHMDGMEVAFLYEMHSDDLSSYRGLKKLREYNEDDVKSMAGVVENIYSI